MDTIIDDEPPMGPPVEPSDRIPVIEESVIEDPYPRIENNLAQVGWIKLIHLKQFHQLHLLTQLRLEILETWKASLQIQFSSIQKLPPNCPVFLTLNQSTWPRSGATRDIHYHLLSIDFLIKFSEVPYMDAIPNQPPLPPSNRRNGTHFFLFTSHPPIHCHLLPCFHLHNEG